MKAGGTGAGASKHFRNVPPWDARTQALNAGLVQKYSVQNWNAFRLVCHIVGITHSKRVPFSLHRKISGCFSRLTTSLEHVFKPVFSWVCKPDRQLSNEIETRLALRKEQRLSRNDAAKRGSITRQQAEALRRRMHRHDMLASMEEEDDREAI